MSETADDEAKRPAPTPSPEDDARTMTRRNLLRAGLALGMVSVFAGIASVTKSLFSPANPPAPSEPPAKTPTVTRTTTQTVTVGGGQGNETASATTSVSSQSTSQTTTTTSSPFPRVLVANVSDLEVSKPVSFNYPLQETPNILVKLGVKADGGVGADGDIVAYSAVCQHLGCIYAYVAPGDTPACDATFKAPGPVGYCCCHGTVYDLVDRGAVTDGPSPRPVPAVVLSVDDSGDIYAIGMTPPTIFGHNTGSSNVLYDLQGGTPVSG